MNLAIDLALELSPVDGTELEKDLAKARLAVTGAERGQIPAPDAGRVVGDAFLLELEGASQAGPTEPVGQLDELAA